MRGPTVLVKERVNATGGFTEPEYARAGLTESEARQTHNVLTTIVRFDTTMRTIIDGRKVGFCKLVVDRDTARVLGGHVVGEHAAEIAQAAAIAMSAGMRVDDLAQVPLAFPTYTAYAAGAAAREIDLDVEWQLNTIGDQRAV